jgi:HK97 family phage major capsid protein
MDYTKIQKRMAEISEEIKKRGSELTDEEVAALDKELDELTTQKRALEESAQKRSDLLAKVAAGDVASASVVQSVNFPGAVQSRSAESDDDDSGDVYSSKQYRSAFHKHVTSGQSMPTEFRAGDITMTSDVGVIIPTTVMNRIVESLTDSGNILPLVTHRSYKGGLQVPTSAAKPTATWVAEGAGSDSQKKVLGYIEFGAYKLRCKVAMTLEVETMSLPIFESTIIANIVEAMTIAFETSVIRGTGVGQPKGILTETVPADRTVTLDGDGITYADLNSAESAIPAEYDNKVEWCMSKSTLIKCLTITDDNGQPIFRNMTDSNGKYQRTLLGRKVNVSSYVTSLNDSTPVGTTVAFLYDFKDYILNINKQVRLKKYEDDETDDQIIKAVALADGKSIKNDSLVKLVTS